MIVAIPSTASMDPTTSRAMPNLSLNPSTTTTPSETNESSDDDDELSVGAIAGIIIGIVAIFVIVAGALASGMSLW